MANTLSKRCKQAETSEKLEHIATILTKSCNKMKLISSLGYERLLDSKDHCDERILSSLIDLDSEISTNMKNIYDTLKLIHPMSQNNDYYCAETIYLLQELDIAIRKRTKLTKTKN
tara:strand:- start:293 stop:640 length:348 start_codon:yes stop_codon:yes gene_type:complete